MRTPTHERKAHDSYHRNIDNGQHVQVKRVFITNVKGTFLGMSESEEASRRR